MQKRRRGNPRRRMLAVLLAAVLTAGTAWEGAVPLTALAQESTDENGAKGSEAVAEKMLTEAGTQTGAEKTDAALDKGEDAVETGAEGSDAGSDRDGAEADTQTGAGEADAGSDGAAQQDPTLNVGGGGGTAILTKRVQPLP